MRTNQKMRVNWNPAFDNTAHCHVVWRQPKDFVCPPSLWASVATYTALCLSVRLGYGSWESGSRLGDRRLSFGVSEKIMERPRIHIKELAVAFVGFKELEVFQESRPANSIVWECYVTFPHY